MIPLPHWCGSQEREMLRAPHMCRGLPQGYLLNFLISAGCGGFHDPHFIGEQAETEANLSCICEAEFSIAWCVRGILFWKYSTTYTLRFRVLPSRLQGCLSSLLR